MNLIRTLGIRREEESEEEVRESVPPPPTLCPIAIAANGSELEPTVQFLREFRDYVVLRSRYKRAFEGLLEMYYCFSPPIARKMERNEDFKQVMKHSVVQPTVALLSTIIRRMELNVIKH